jgi:5,5'-dehydrodivanillate O-demethylase
MGGNMMAAEENQRLSQVGPDTPGGKLLRRYWQPVAATVALKDRPTLRVRIMGEDLVLYRDRSGAYGLVQERCPHRSASLALGIPEENGLRCRYHGWLFSKTGSCLEQPFEDKAGSGNYKNHIRVTAYPVQELGGLLFAYLGPDPAPLLPRLELLLDTQRHRKIQTSVIPCNWLQCQENSLDPVHFEWLHAHGSNDLARRAGLPDVMVPREHLKIAFDVFEFGIMKRRLLEGDDPATSDIWNVGHPMLFPNVLAGNGLQYRVPIDDGHTLHISYQATDTPDGAGPQSEVPAEELPYADGEGNFILTSVLQQDLSAWVTQGPIAPRELENLGRSDRGILIFRRWLKENIDKVARGEEPGGLIRDPALNEPYFNVPGMKGRRAAATLSLNSLDATGRLQHTSAARAAV